MVSLRDGYDFDSLVKYSFIAGAAMIVAGVVGEIAGLILGGLPDWEMTLFADLLGLGMLTVFITFVVGVLFLIPIYK